MKLVFKSSSKILLPYLQVKLDLKQNIPISQNIPAIAIPIKSPISAKIFANGSVVFVAFVPTYAVKAIAIKMNTIPDTNLFL
jgi:hypothetical protein